MISLHTRKCFSLALLEIWTIFKTRMGSVVDTPPVSSICHWWASAHSCSILSRCGVRLYLYPSVCPERPAEVTKTASHLCRLWNHITHRSRALRQVMTESVSNKLEYSAPETEVFFVYPSSSTCSQPYYDPPIVTTSGTGTIPPLDPGADD